MLLRYVNMLCGMEAITTVQLVILNYSRVVAYYKSQPHAYVSSTKDWGYFSTRHQKPHL